MFTEAEQEVLISARNLINLKLCAFSAAVMLIVGLNVIVNAHYRVEQGITNKTLTGCAFHNFTIASIVQCFIACVEDCLCKSFQIYKNAECQLLTSNQYQSPAALVNMTGYSYYDMVPPTLKQVKTMNSNMCNVRCKLLKNPCVHGGNYHPVFPTDYTTPRFRCNCLPGYTGNLCQDVVKSCRGYMNGTRVPDKYKMFDNNLNLYQVFCDFDLNSTMAWTLVQSYELQNKNNFLQGLLADSPVNENTTRWDSYRLSKPRMQAIQADSTTFRATCQYDTEGVVYTDYLQASKIHVDILTYTDEHPSYPCPFVDFINIRGQKCENCSAFIHQTEDMMLHSDSYFAATKGCDFRPTHSKSCSLSGEDNFGAYFCTNPAHRCSSSSMATTQTWLGGN